MPANILIVEDETIVAMEIGLLLEDLGHRIAGFATDSGSALARADAGGIDLALVDIHLADGPTGVELGRRLAMQGIEVLFVTGNPTMIDCTDKNCVGAIEKPANDEVIAEAVLFALARKEGRNVSPPAQLRVFS